MNFDPAMIVFPNCKINLGLHVVSKRPDGYHNIETVFYPVNWCDALELLENEADGEPFELKQQGLGITGGTESNLVYKAWQLLSQSYALPPLKVFLYKNLPMGAGLGGGSSDAAFFIKLANIKFNLNISEHQQMQLASRLGSDCAFFIGNSPQLARGKGNEFSEISVTLRNYYILVVYPAVHSNTQQAYGGLTPHRPQYDIKLLENEPVKHWKHFLVNDFEETVFKKHPHIKQLKENLYKEGALYASMSGSGSAVYGIFTNEPKPILPVEYQYYLQKPQLEIL